MRMTRSATRSASRSYASPGALTASLAWAAGAGQAWQAPPKGQRLAYSEGQQNGRLICDAKEVSLLQQRYDTLRSQALNAKDSRALLERLRGEADL